MCVCWRALAFLLGANDYYTSAYRAETHGCSHGEGARQGQGRQAIGGYATRREIYEAVDAALDAPLSEHGVEGYNLSVRDCYVDQDCDGMWVTEVTEDTVTAACQYCS